MNYCYLLELKFSPEKASMLQLNLDSHRILDGNLKRLRHLKIQRRCDGCNYMLSSLRPAGPPCSCWRAGADGLVPAGSGPGKRCCDILPGGASLHLTVGGQSGCKGNAEGTGRGAGWSRCRHHGLHSLRGGLILQSRSSSAPLSGPAKTSFLISEAWPIQIQAARHERKWGLFELRG